MAIEFGKNWRLKIGDGEASEAFDAIGGEGGLDWTRQSKEIDTGSKDTGQYGTMGYGRQTVSFRVSGKLTLRRRKSRPIPTAASTSSSWASGPTCCGRAGRRSTRSSARPSAP